MSIRRSSRLLTTLTSAKPTASTLVPPYSHSQSVPEEPSPSLRPPYAHASANPVQGEGPAVQAKLKYTLLDRNVAREQAKKEETYRAWAEGLGEATIQRVWDETLVALKRVQQDGTQVPEIAFHELSQHLGGKSTVKDLKRIGMVIVRDVIADADAQAAGEELRAYVQARAGHPTYWHQLLVALRANTSVLSANSQVMAALTGAEARYIRADTLSSLAQSATHEPFSLNKPWSSRNALSANFALSPARAGTYQAVPSIHAARYAALRPLFKSRQSLISFYNKEGYLDPSNWALSSSPSFSTVDQPHLTPEISVDLPALAPGDMVYSHSALPIALTKPGIGKTDFLPLSPLASGFASESEVQAQRDAYERGVPPPHVLVEGTVALEEAGKPGALVSNGGRTAMGY